MTLDDVLKELASYGNEQTKKVYLNHGAQEPFYGVKVGDLKKIVKKIKKDHELSLALFETGNSDAMYLAGLIADEKRITKKDLLQWVKQANWYMISEYTVPWITSETPYALELGESWIGSQKESIASSGWSTLASYVSIVENEAIDFNKFSALLDDISENIHSAPNRVRYTMNNFIIAVGSYVPELTDKAKETAAKIGKVSVDMGGTACKVPFALDYILKVENANRLGRKRKTARC